jgi:hypothetical protein
MGILIKRASRERCTIAAARKAILVRLLTVLALLQCCTGLSAEEQDEVTGGGAFGNKPLVVYLDDEKSRHLRFSAWFQVWLRHTELNPGSTVSSEGVRSDVTDLSIRRFRLGVWGPVTERLFVFTQLGLNNLNYLSERGVSIDLLDAYAEYEFSPNHYVGGGKSAWIGLSRYSAPSPLTSLTMDIPFVALPTLNTTDDLLRRLSIYAKGSVSGLDYRVILFQPQSVEQGSEFDPEPDEGIAKFTDNSLGGSLGVSAYVKWQFFEKENNRTAFSPGSYLGSKKVVNVGAGFEHNRERTWHLVNGERVFNDVRLWAIDCFADLPLNEVAKTAVTVYGGYFDYDYGPNFIGNVGINNPANGVVPELASFNGAGNAYPILGAGHSFYLQAGYLLPRIRGRPKLGQIQPYFDVQYSDWERLADPMVVWNVGANWLLSGHHSKLSLNVQRRPIFFDGSGGIQVDDHDLAAVLQYQIWVN